MKGRRALGFAALFMLTWSDGAATAGTNQYLTLDGTNGAVLTTPGTYGDRLNRFTVSAWVRPNTAPKIVNQIIIERSLIIPVQVGLNVVLRNLRNFRLALTPAGRFYAEYNDSTGNRYSAIASTPLDSNNWSYVAGSYDGTSLFVYVNTELKGLTHTLSTPVNGWNANPTFSIYGSVCMGAEINDTSGDATNLDLYFGGSLDEAEVWDGALGDDQLHANMFKKPLGTESNLVGYWSFDDGTPSDATTNANYGLFHGNATSVVGSIYYPATLLITCTSPGSISLQTVQDTFYDIESNQNLLSNQWETISSDLQGDGGMLCITDAPNPFVSGFYRVRSH